MTALQWLSTAARTGEIIADLPLLSLGGPLKVTIGRYESVQATLPINAKDAPPDWLRATKKNASHLICLQENPNDPAHGIPLAGYRINRRYRDHTDQIRLDLMTVESYLDRRYVGTKTYTNVGQNDIMADLIASFVAEGVKPGIPIRVVYTTAGSGFIRTRNYLDQDNKTVYSIAQDLMSVIGGCEWTIGWEWQSTPERLTAVLYVGDRIGSAAPSIGPAATFEFPSKYGTAFELIEDFSVGSGANDTMAYSTGQGTSVLQSPHATKYDPDMPTVEYRWTPSTSISDVNTLTDYANSAVSTMFAGSTALSMSATVDAPGTPKFLTDWGIGDDIGYLLGGTDTWIDPASERLHESVPSVPGGLSGTARAAGWERTLDNTATISPILVSSTGAFDNA